jgi:hypothetical protein
VPLDREGRFRRDERSGRGERRAPLRQEFPHQRAVAAALVLAVAADREIGRVRQRGEQVQHAAGLRPAHLGPIAPGQRAPAALLLRAPSDPEQLLGRRQIRKPHVVEIPARELGLRHASRRTPNGPDPQPLTLGPRASQAHDADRRGRPCIPLTHAPGRRGTGVARAHWPSGPWKSGSFVLQGAHLVTSTGLLIPWGTTRTHGF